MPHTSTHAHCMLYNNTIYRSITIVNTMLYFSCVFTCNKWWPINYYIVLQLASCIVYNVYCSPSSVHPVCPAAPFRPSSSPGATVTTPCSSVHPSLNPRGVITWQCLPDFTWEGDWSGCTFPEGVGHAVAPLAYRVAAGASEVNNSIQAIVSEVGISTDTLYVWCHGCRTCKLWCIQCMHAPTYLASEHRSKLCFKLLPWPPLETSMWPTLDRVEILRRPYSCWQCRWNITLSKVASTWCPQSVHKWITPWPVCWHPHCGWAGLL